MKVEYINAFIASTKATFSEMLGCEITRSDLFTMETFEPRHEITGIIGLTGKALGSVALSLSKPLALKATEAMLMESYTEINEDVVDAVGELANMVAGGAKAKLEQYQMSVTLPSIIVGKSTVLSFPHNVVPICIGFESSWGELTVQAGIAECPEGVLVSS